MHTKAVEDYLKAAYEVHRGQGQVTTNALAKHLGVASHMMNVQLGVLSLTIALLVHSSKLWIGLNAITKKIFFCI